MADTKGDEVLIRRHYGIFGEWCQLSTSITLKQGGSCAMGGSTWSHNYVVYYKQQWTNIIDLQADKDGAYVACFEAPSVNYRSGNITDPMEREKMVQFLERYGEILLTNHTKAQKHFKVQRMSGLNYYWIHYTEEETYGIYSLSDGTVRLEKVTFSSGSDQKHTPIATYQNIDELIEKNAHLHKSKLYCGLL